MLSLVFIDVPFLVHLVASGPPRAQFIYQIQPSVTVSGKGALSSEGCRTLMVGVKRGCIEDDGLLVLLSTPIFPSQKSPCTRVGVRTLPSVSRGRKSRSMTLVMSPLRSSRISSLGPCVFSSVSKIFSRPREKHSSQLLHRGNSWGFRPPYVVIGNPNSPVLDSPRRWKLSSSSINFSFSGSSPLRNS